MFVCVTDYADFFLSGPSSKTMVLLVIQCSVDKKRNLVQIKINKTCFSVL